MRCLLLFTAILYLLSFQLLGCGEDTDSLTTEVMETEGPVTATGAETSPAEPILFTPEAVFERLWNAFGGRFEGNEVNFQRLREITTSQIYLDYLAEAFPTEEPVQTLEEYFQVAPPAPEKYTPFLQERVGEATEEGIIVIHRLISALREAEFVNAQPLGGDIPDGGLWLEKALAPFATVVDPAIQDFKRRHKVADGDWDAQIIQLYNTMTNEDAAWLEAQMETHGTDTGLVWGAIYRPAFIGEILIHLGSLANLHAWIDFRKLISENIENF